MLQAVDRGLEVLQQILYELHRKHRMDKMFLQLLVQLHLLEEQLQKNHWSQDGKWDMINTEEDITSTIITGVQHGNVHNRYHQVGKWDEIHEEEYITWIITPDKLPGRGQIVIDYKIWPIGKAKEHR